ncbi:MAG: UPF0182 family protein [Proteobacteria bacterium]|nr:UPF0182 family protein [Pseudomonadota bacterium]
MGSKGSTVAWTLAAGAFGLLVALALLSAWVVEWLWFGELGYRQVFWRVRLAQFTLFTATFVSAFVYFRVNLGLLARQIVTPGSGLGGTVTEALRLWATPLRLKVLATALAAAAALPFALAMAASWDALIRFESYVPFGEDDPILGHDIGFYVFRLPLLDAVQNALTMAAFVMLAGLALAYHQLGLFGRLAAMRVPPPASALRLAAVNLALFVAGWGGGYVLDRFAILYEGDGVVFGAGYADVGIVLPGLAVMVGGSLAVVGILLWGAYAVAPRPMLVGLGAYVGLGLLALGVIPALVQRFAVGPNELELEAPYLRHNIAATRRAFAIDGVEARAYPALSELTLAEIRANPDTLGNVRLWDWRPLLQTYRQIQEIRLYYRFYDVDVDRYRLSDGYRQVMLSARELAERLPERARTWVNEKLQYTHGYGVTMSLAAQEGEEGTPNLLVKDLPPVSVSGLAIREPAIYFGASMPGYRIVATSIPEFSHPKGDENVYDHYRGRGGIPLDAYWKRLLFAFNRLDVNILLSDYLGPASRIQLWRRVAERVGKAAPFLRLDSDPYLAVVDGRLFWIQDAYTTSDRYPYSEPYRGGFNYIRNSVKAVVDAYEGSVDLYLIDPADPVIAAYRRAFPGLFKDFAEMPAGLRAHLRYPQDIFAAQVDRYRSYHMTNPQVFYNQEDLWVVPNEKYAGAKVTMEPYYILMRLPGEAQLEFLLMTPLTPQNRDNMIAWMAARSDFPRYGALVVYKLPKERLVYGPIQIEALIDQDTTISRQLSLWDQKGSRVIRGNLMVIPLDHSLLYVEPVYLIAENNDVPQLKRVIVAYGNRVVMEPTLEMSLAALFGGRQEAAPGAAPKGRAEAERLGRIGARIEAAERALKAGDWAAFGRAIGDVMGELKDVLGPGARGERGGAAD